MWISRESSEHSLLSLKSTGSGCREEKMARIYNFSAGPSVLPEEVLKQAAEEMLDYRGSGMCVAEMSHRSKVYDQIITEAEADLRELMAVPDNYDVLFLQGGASLQFAMIPINLMTGSNKMDIIKTGIWTKKAIKEAERVGTVNVVASSEDTTFDRIPELDKNKFDKDADYFYICSNNTIFGTKYDELPDTGDVPLVSDMSSCILSEPVDVSRFGVIFAGAQKNMGPAGLTAVIIRKDLVEKAPDNLMTMMQYRTHSENRSMFNTPPTYAVYMAGLVFKWLKKLGGLGEMKKINVEKAGMLYDYLDESRLFTGPVKDKRYRSLMNVTFVTGNADLDKKFVAEAEQAGFVNLKGHRLVGGMRASIYNAMPVEGVRKLVEFMKNFETENL